MPLCPKARITGHMWRAGSGWISKELRWTRKRGSNDMERILLHTVDAASESKDPAKLQGAFVRGRNAFHGNDYPVYGLPEFGPPRFYYDGFRLIHRDGVVIPSADAYTVCVLCPPAKMAGFPKEAVVEFIPTSDPQTYYLPGGPNMRLPHLTFVRTTAIHPEPGLPRIQGCVRLQPVHPRDRLGRRRQPERALCVGSRGHSRQGLARSLMCMI